MTTHLSSAEVHVFEEGWFVDEEDAKVIHMALTIFLLSIEQNEFRDRVCEVNRKFKDHYKKEGGVK